MRSCYYLLHNKLENKTNFSVDQLSQALELTASDETSTEEQKWELSVLEHWYQTSDESQIDIFALEIEESFAVICPKIIEKVLENSGISRQYRSDWRRFMSKIYASHQYQWIWLEVACESRFCSWK
jgi:hypothetical protein